MAEWADKGRDIVAKFNAGQYAEVVAASSAAVAAAMPAEAAEQLWTTLIDQAGAFQSVVEAKEADQGGYHVAFVHCAFEKVGMIVRILFDADGLMAGLNFKPKV